MTDTIEKIQPAGEAWKFRNEPSPQVTVQGFAVDPQGRFPILFRNDKVRSAKNCWSLPSGLHEAGLNVFQQFAIELEEELGLEAINLERSKVLGMYENIAAVDSWHWVIIMVAVPVASLTPMTNKEPDKHSKLEILTPWTWDETKIARQWGPGLGEWLATNRKLFNTLGTELHG